MILARLIHKLFYCPTFWLLMPAFRCPDCGQRYRCVWDGADCQCGVVHLCARCYQAAHAGHDGKSA
jgi:hypothetical protein